MELIFYWKMHRYKCYGENSEARGIRAWICPLAGLFRDGFPEKVTVEQRPAELEGLALAGVWGKGKAFEAEGTVHALC